MKEIVESEELVRLNKVIALAGAASRRMADQLIKQGDVLVNGQVVTELGTKVDPAKDHIRVSGRLLSSEQPKVYIAFYKPKGMITSLKDDKDRPVISDLLARVKVRVFPIGRLDFDVEGLLLCTNDGEMANRLMHPRSRIPKCYWVKIKGIPDVLAIQKLRKGVDLKDGKTLPARVKLQRKGEANAWIEITVHEGRNHLIKRMMEAVGHPALKIVRFSFAGILLSDLVPGAFRYLTPREIQFLKKQLRQ